jgi:hypothetical protein
MLTKSQVLPANGNAQFEAIRLNGVCINSMTENRTEIFLKLSDEGGHLRKNNETMKMKMERRHDLLCCDVCWNRCQRWVVTSLAALKVNLVKIYRYNI